MRLSIHAVLAQKNQTHRRRRRVGGAVLEQETVQLGASLDFEVVRPPLVAFPAYQIVNLGIRKGGSPVPLSGMDAEELGPPIGAKARLEGGPIKARVSEDHAPNRKMDQVLDGRRADLAAGVAARLRSRDPLSRRGHYAFFLG